MALSTAYFWCFGHCIDWLSYEAKIYPNNALVTEVKMRGGMTGWQWEQDGAIFKTEKNDRFGSNSSDHWWSRWWCLVAGGRLGWFIRVPSLIGHLANSPHLPSSDTPSHTYQWSTVVHSGILVFNNSKFIIESHLTNSSDTPSHTHTSIVVSWFSTILNFHQFIFTLPTRLT